MLSKDIIKISLDDQIRLLPLKTNARSTLLNNESSKVRINKLLEQSDPIIQTGCSTTELSQKHIAMFGNSEAAILSLQERYMKQVVS